MTKTPILLSLAAALALAACGQASSPSRKAGLWEQSFQGDRSPTPIVTQACFDALWDRRMPVVPRQSKREARFCQQFNVSRSGADYVVDATCGIPGGPTIKRHEVISGDFSSRYTTVSTIDISNSPVASRNGRHTATVTDVYKGACPPSIAPGQVRLPNGEVIDMAALRGRRGGMGGGERGAGAGAAANSAPAPTNTAPAPAGQGSGGGPG